MTYTQTTLRRDWLHIPNICLLDMGELVSAQPQGGTHTEAVFKGGGKAIYRVPYSQFETHLVNALKNMK